ncbi:hypothetical protein Tco_0428223, partial [Tanacetum coccineum]
MALWQSQREDHTSDWLCVVSISGLGQTMNGISAGNEVDIGLGGGCDKALRPADMLLYSWDRGFDVCVDLTGSSHLTQTGMADFVPGQVVIDAAQRKRDAVTLLKQIQKFSMAQGIGARAAVHIFNRISFFIAKGVRAQIVSQLPFNLSKEARRMEQKHIMSSSVYNQMPPLSANHQWIVAQNLDAEDETQVQIFYDVHDPLRYYRCQIPELLGKHVRGCFYGWVILSNHPRNVMWSLWNPVTSKVINLPRLIYKQSDSDDDDDDDDDDIDCCCLTSPPDDPNSVLLMSSARKPHFVFCRLHPKKKKLRWTEMSYAKQVKNVTGEDRFLNSLTCCDGKVYAYTVTSLLVVELSIVVKDTGVAVNLSSLLKFPDFSPVGHSRRSYLVGTCKDIFIIYIDFDDVGKTISNVNLFKLDMNSKTWEELEDLKDATIILDIDGYLYPEFHSLAIGSELGGSIHILGEIGGIIYSYHVKDKTISLSFVPCLVGTSHVSTWAMLESKRPIKAINALYSMPPAK